MEGRCKWPLLPTAAGCSEATGHQYFESCSWSPKPMPRLPQERRIIRPECLSLSFCPKKKVTLTRCNAQLGGCMPFRGSRLTSASLFMYGVRAGKIHTHGNKRCGEGYVHWWKNTALTGFRAKMIDLHPSWSVPAGEISQFSSWLQPPTCTRTDYFLILSTVTLIGSFVTSSALSLHSAVCSSVL